MIIRKKRIDLFGCLLTLNLDLVTLVTEAMVQEDLKDGSNLVEAPKKLRSEVRVSVGLGWKMLQQVTMEIKRVMVMGRLSMPPLDLIFPKDLNQIQLRDNLK